MTYQCKTIMSKMLQLMEFNFFVVFSEKKEFLERPTALELKGDKPEYGLSCVSGYLELIDELFSISANKILSFSWSLRSSFF